MEDLKLCINSPKKVNHQMRQLIEFLELDESMVTLLKFSSSISFDPEPRNCHLNAWVKLKFDGGSLQHGWILAEDSKKKFCEAVFHTVWVSPEGKYHDVTPRLDGEKIIMFIPDFSRHIQLSKHVGEPAIISYDNVRIFCGRVLSGLSKNKMVPQTEMFKKYDLFS